MNQRLHPFSDDKKDIYLNCCNYWTPSSEGLRVWQTHPRENILSSVTSGKWLFSLTSSSRRLSHSHIQLDSNYFWGHPRQCTLFRFSRKIELTRNSPPLSEKTNGFIRRETNDVFRGICPDFCHLYSKCLFMGTGIRGISLGKWATLYHLNILQPEALHIWGNI